MGISFFPFSRRKGSSMRIQKDIASLIKQYKKHLPDIAGGVCLVLFYSCSRMRASETHVYHVEKATEFKDGKILARPGETIYEGKERLYSKSMKDLVGETENLKTLILKQQGQLDELIKGKGASPTSLGQVGPIAPSPSLGDQVKSEVGRPTSPVSMSAAPSNIEPHLIGRGSRRWSKGPAVVSFPVKDAFKEDKLSVVIPPGSYVKSRLMTGVEAPEGRTYPVLLQLDYAYIVPNHKKLDLSGCFMIAKSEGDLSTERVQMQATKLSCVSKTGKMFERDVSGFIADDKDNSFAVIGSVSSKQDRVAAMAFLASVVEGVGKAVQMAQTNQTLNPLGGASTAITGNSAAYLGGGAAANAAGLVTQWYLKQAQNLLPTINVGSGQDVWIVMQETVNLPVDYFKKANGGSDVFSYISRISE